MLLEGKAGKPDQSSTSEGERRTAQDSWWHLLVGRHRTLVAILFVLVGAVVVGSIGGFVYTFTPGFCTTCHIMEPYFESWQTSTHGELGVSCIKCHYSPGFVNTVRGKLKGVSELVVFLTSRRLHRFASSIEDASCLRPGCHDTRLLEGETEFANARFDHTPHLTEERRGKQVRCTSCHSQIVQGTHITVTATTCYLCHFKNQALGEGVSNCLLCHAVPDTMISLVDGTDFDHVGSAAEEIGCSHCHAKDVRGKGEVPKECCTVCHQDPAHLALYGDVELMHENHVTEYKIECLDCHLAIEHGSLKPPEKLDCAVCHQDPHVATEWLMAGDGEEDLEEMPSRKHLIGVACESCHDKEVQGTDGSTVSRATAGACDRCHGEGTGELIAEWEETTAEALAEFKPVLGRVGGRLGLYPDKKSESYQLAREKYEAAARLGALVEMGHAVHNPEFASVVLEKALEHLEEAEELVDGG